jgi:hypothetical protein
MAEPTIIHVVVAFTKTEDDEIAADPPQQMPTAGQATQRAKMQATTHAGAIAWSRTLEPDTGDYSDPVILVRLGTIPDWFDETGDAGG